MTEKEARHVLELWLPEQPMTDKWNLGQITNAERQSFGREIEAVLGFRFQFIPRTQRNGVELRLTFWLGQALLGEHRLVPRKPAHARQLFDKWCDRAARKVPGC